MKYEIGTTVFGYLNQTRRYYSAFLPKLEICLILVNVHKRCGCHIWTYHVNSNLGVWRKTNEAVVTCLHYRCALWGQITTLRYSSIIGVTILATIQTTHKKYSSISPRDKYCGNHVIRFAESNINSCVALVIFHLINMLVRGNNAVAVSMKILFSN